MGTHGVEHIVQHGIVHGIHTARNGFQQSPTADDGIELKGNVIGLQRFQHQVLAEFELVDDAGKLGKLLHRMPDVEYQTGSFILIDSNFVEVEPGFTASIFIDYDLQITNYKLLITIKALSPRWSGKPWQCCNIWTNRNRYATVIPPDMRVLAATRPYRHEKTEIQPYKSIARFDVWEYQHIRLPVNR